MCAKKTESRLDRLERRLELMRQYGIDLGEAAGSWLNIPEPPAELLTPFSQEPPADPEA